MRIARDRLVFAALVALQQVVDRSQREPIKPDYSLRFLLGFLYAIGDADRVHFEKFWRTCQEPHLTAPTPDRACYVRGTHVQTCWEAIARGTGAQLTIDFIAAIKGAARTAEERRSNAAPPR